MIATLSQNWWVLAVRGVAAILFGIGAYLWPGMTISALVLLFGAYALVDGIFAISAGFAVRKQQERWWTMLVTGLISVLTGVLTFLWPGLTALSLLYLIASWCIATGIFEIVAAIRLRKEIEGEWMLILAGIASLIAGMLLVSIPGAGALTLVWLIGGYALVYGVLLLVLAFRVRDLHKTVEQLPSGAA